MFKRNAMGNTRTKLVAGAVLLCLGLTAGSAMATNVYGGGATLPAGAYVGFNFLSLGSGGSASINKLSNNTGAGQTGGAAVGGIFGAWATASGNKIGYCQTGSGNGKKVFDHFDGTNVLTGASGTCDGTTAGFGAAAGTPDPFFAASDAPMSLDEFRTWFNAGGKQPTYVQPVEFPAIAGAIAIVYHNSTIPATTRLSLSRAQVCGVFSGSITTWNQIDASFGSQPIKIAYRSDGSGTTFSLANYLANACATSPAVHFTVDQAFTNVVALQPIGSTLGTVGIPQSGNPAVVDAVNTNDFTIGYAEAANVGAAQAVGADANVKMALVETRDPLTDLASPVNLSSLIQFDRTVSANTTTGHAVLTAISPAPASTNCVLVANPDGYALPASGSTRYPIIAVSYLIANNKGNGTSETTVEGLLSSVYTATGLPAGYATVSFPGTSGTGAANRITTCVAP